MEQPGNDIELFTRIKKNDRLALNTLFATYYQKLCAFAHLYLENREESEEVVSDVFINLWKTRAQLAIEKNFRSYLYVSVKHACFAILKKQKLDFEEMDDSLEDLISDQPNPEQLINFYELKQHLDQVIDRLPFRCRQIFRMSRFDGLKYKEISEILSISEKTVENQLAKALDILRTQVDADWNHHQTDPPGRRPGLSLNRELTNP